MRGCMPLRPRLKLRLRRRLGMCMVHICLVLGGICWSPLLVTAIEGGDAPQEALRVL